MAVLWISSLLKMGADKSLELLRIQQKITTALSTGLEQQVNAFATTIVMASISYSFRSKMPNYPLKGAGCMILIGCHSFLRSNTGIL